MKGSAFFKIPIHPYNRQLLVAIGLSDDEFERKLKEVLPEDDLKDLEEDNKCIIFSPGTTGRVITFNNSGLVLWLKTMPATPTTQNYLAHEIFHVVEAVFERIEMPLTSETSEAYAYLIGYLTETIYKNL